MGESQRSRVHGQAPRQSRCRKFRDLYRRLVKCLTLEHLCNPGAVREANEDTAAPAAASKQQAKPILPPVEEKKPEKKTEERPEIVEVAKPLPPAPAPAPAPAVPKEASPTKVVPATSSPAPSPAKPEKLTLGGKVLRVKVICLATLRYQSTLNSFFLVWIQTRILRIHALD